MFNRVVKQVYGNPRGRISILMDRDGTINYDDGYVHEVQKLKLTENFVEFAKSIEVHRTDIYVATNQGGVALGMFDVADMKKFNDALVAELKLMHLNVVACYSCIHHPKAQRIVNRFCTCRKPKSGLYRQLINDFDLERNSISVIGNSERDIEAAFNLGLPAYKVNDSISWAQAKRKTLEA